MKTIAALAENPRPIGNTKLKGTEAYRMRTSDYGVIYEIHEKIIAVVVIDIGHRREIYRNL